jgi:hypothetical protein
MNPWVFAAGALLNFLGQQQAGNQAAAANALGEKQMEAQNRIVDYLLGRRRTLYDPLEEQEILPRITERIRNTPFYAQDWLRQARQLRRPMSLAY